jgi:hypothetical protein
VIRRDLGKVRADDAQPVTILGRRPRRNPG